MCVILCASRVWERGEEGVEEEDEDDEEDAEEDAEEDSEEDAEEEAGREARVWTRPEGLPVILVRPHMRELMVLLGLLRVR